MKRRFFAAFLKKTTMAKKIQKTEKIEKREVAKVVFLKSPSGKFLLPYVVGQLVEVDKIQPKTLEQMMDENYCENV